MSEFPTHELIANLDRIARTLEDLDNAAYSDAGSPQMGVVASALVRIADALEGVHFIRLDRLVLNLNAIGTVAIYDPGDFHPLTGKEIEEGGFVAHIEMAGWRERNSRTWTVEGALARKLIAALEERGTVL